MTSFVHLHRIDPDKSMARFYAMSVQPNLFGEWSLVLEWGRIGSNGRIVARHLASEHDAACAMTKQLKTKLRRGYTAV